jgi:hypothetical protein
MYTGTGNDGYPQRWYNEGMNKFDDYRWIPCETTADAEVVGGTANQPLIVPNIVGADIDAVQLSLALGATKIYGDALNDTLPVIQFH